MGFERKNMLSLITDFFRNYGDIGSVMPPTQFYNETWMLRFMLDRLAKNREIQHDLCFAPYASWYSEALLASRFLPEQRGDSKAESYTHADGVVGHFTVDTGKRAKIRLLPEAKQFVVIEAKLGSPLSAGTTNVPGYDQAARNVACIAHLLGDSNIIPSSFDSLAFFVVAPEEKICTGMFTELLQKDSIENKVRRRVEQYGPKYQDWFNDRFLPVIHHIKIKALSWESLLNVLPCNTDTASLAEFYEMCLNCNLPQQRWRKTGRYPV